MFINCFRGGASGEPVHELPKAARYANPAKTSRVKRQGTSSSSISATSSNTSNESISRLPPCKRESDPRVEAMMMALPYDPRPSQCLRLSHPRIYSRLVGDMKSAKGCRDWKNFDVFHTDDVDMSTSADEAARQKALEYQRKWKQLNSFESGPSTYGSASLDTVD